MVQNVVVEPAGQRTGVDQLLRIDAGGGAAGQVADIVGPGAARCQTELVDRGQHLDRVSSADLADLQVRSGGDMKIAAAILLFDRRQPLRLMGGQGSRGQTQPQHESVLIGRHIKEPVEFVQEDVGSFGKATCCRVGEHLVPHVERGLGPLGELLRNQLGTGFEPPVLRL